MCVSWLSWSKSIFLIIVSMGWTLRQLDVGVIYEVSLVLMLERAALLVGSLLGALYAIFLHAPTTRILRAGEHATSTTLLNDLMFRVDYHFVREMTNLFLVQHDHYYVILINFVITHIKLKVLVNEDIFLMVFPAHDVMQAKGAVEEKKIKGEIFMLR
ncbi:hypothetical protein ACJX0J_038884 [Zea mays]